MLRPARRAFALPLSAALLFAAPKPTIQDARLFLDSAEKQGLLLATEAQRADWVKDNFITYDTETLAAKTDERAINAGVAFAKKAAEFNGVALPEDMARKMKLLRNALTVATPADPHESEELTSIVASMEGTYGKGKYCPHGTDKCLDLEDLTKLMATSRDPKELLDAWTGWHAISKPIRQPFARYVELANKGARELGFADTGAMWREKYDMPPDAFAAEMDRLWEQVRPLYVSLHTYVRAKLREKYGSDVVPANGPHPGSSARQYVGAGLGQHLRHCGPSGRGASSYDLDCNSASPAHDARTDGPLWRGLFQVARVCPASADFLGAVAVCEAARSRSGVSRERLGHRFRRRPPHQDVHRDHARKTFSPSTTNWDTTSISGRITSSRSCSAIAPMTDSTKRLATRSPSPSRRSTW